MKSLKMLTFLPLFLLMGMLACSSSTSTKQEGDTTLTEADTAHAEAQDTLVQGAEMTTADWETADSIVMNCGGALNLAKPVNVIAANISRDSLQYDVEPFSDCSGIFHRFLDSLSLRCPDFAYPDKKYRDSRALGKWYHEQGHFVRVNMDNVLDMSHLIKPGAVMFYGPRNGKIDTLGIEALFAPGGINHLGVIVAVAKNDQGVVTGYSLFHGRRPGKLASTTNYHKRSYRNRPEYPPYGNGSEQWVGVAPVIANEKMKE